MVEEAERHSSFVADFGARRPRLGEPDVVRMSFER
jgi:hypothetical protein